MGKGDKKSRKGKIAKGSFGNSRKKQSLTNISTGKTAKAATATAKAAK